MRGGWRTHEDRHYLLVDGVNGRIHYVDIGKGDATPFLPEGAILRVAAREAKASAADRTIIEVAAANGGRYSIEAHLCHDPMASEAFAAAHVRRLEAMRRRLGGLERGSDGTWTIPPDHLERATYEAGRLREQPVSVDLLSPIPLDQLVHAEAATWIDRELAAAAPLALRDCGFGREVRAAQSARRQWLIAKDLAGEADGRLIFRADAIATLQRRELMRVASRLAQELGLDFLEAKTGDPVEGRFCRTVDMASGRHALIERSRDFTLVPWRPVLDRHVGRAVSGIMRESGPSWSIGRGRSGPSPS